MASDAIQAELIGSPLLYFSYGQLMVYDSSERQPGSLWTDDHVRQGFVRRRHAIGFGTIFSNGNAALRVFRGESVDNADYQRVICVPIELPSGELHIEGPEEYPVERVVRVEPGSYRICIAQSAVDDDSLKIDAFISVITGTASESNILKGHDLLNPPDKLIETGEVAQ